MSPVSDAAPPSAAPRQSRAAARASARLAAVQGLYQMDIAGTGIEAVVAERLGYAFIGDRAPDDATAEPVEPPARISPPPATESAAEDAAENLAPADQEFLEALLRGVVRRQREIDPAVDHQLATGWRLVRIDSTARAILRAGVFELMERTDIPVRVVISEYVQIAHAFFSGEEPKMVNAVLDNLARTFRPAEFDGRPA